MHVEVPYGERLDSFCDWVVRGLFVFDPEPHPPGLVVSLITTDFVKKTDGNPGIKELQIPALSARRLADGWLGQYNRKHRNENEIAAFPRVAASQVCLSNH